MITDPLQKYKSATVSGGDPVKQLVFIFDEVLKLLYIAGKAMKEKDYETKFKSLTKISDVFYVLKSGLKPEGEGEGKELIKMLDSFYDATIYNIHQLNMKADDASEVDKVIKSMSMVRDALQNEINKGSANKA